MDQQYNGAVAGLNVADIQSPNIGRFVFRSLHRLMFTPDKG
jgi:hypothetical protein